MKGLLFGLALSIFSNMVLADDEILMSFRVESENPAYVANIYFHPYEHVSIDRGDRCHGKYIQDLERGTLQIELLGQSWGCGERSLDITFQPSDMALFYQGEKVAVTINTMELNWEPFSATAVITYRKP